MLLFVVSLIREKQMQGYVNAAHIAQGMATSSQAKIVVMEYWSRNGELPCTSTELEAFGMSMATQSGNPVVPRMDLTGCGQITLTFQQNSGVDGGMIVLQAREVQGAFGLSINWACSTKDYMDIARYVPQCTFSEDRPVNPIAEPVTTGSTAVDLSGEGAGETAHTNSQIQACENHAVLYRSVFADAVENRIPQHRIAVIGPQRDTIHFFTEVIGAGGSGVTHEWFHDDVAVAAVPFDIKADRWRTWSSKHLEYLGPGTLRVEVRDGECLIGQESIKIADQEIEDPAALSGWMRPRQAVEKTLAEQANETASSAERQKYVDDLVGGGDTSLLAAIRRGNTSRALSLIRQGDSSIRQSYPNISREEYQRHIMMANPFLSDATGVSPIELAHQLGQVEVVEALIESATMLDTRGRGRSGYTRHGRWDDHILRITRQPELTRFEDGDTPLIRAVRTHNGRAVVALLGLATWGRGQQPYPATELLYAYDAGGRQALDIARDAGYYGIERFLELAIERGSPKWAVTRSMLTTHMVDGEPGQCRQAAFDDEKKLIFFAEMTDMSGQTIYHEWALDGQTMQRNEFEIKNRRWTTQSSRQFSAEDVGNWQVKVTTAQGEVLRTEYLTYHALTPYLERNRKNYNHNQCEMGSAALYAFVKAHAPVARIQYLIDKGLSLEVDSRRSKDLLYQAIGDGNITLTRWFLDRGSDIDGYLENSTTALMAAAKGGDEAMVLYLLKRGADIEKQQSYGEKVALQFAANNNHPGVTRILLENGANPNTRDSQGITPVSRAVHACGLETTRVLIEYGADPTIIDKQNKGPAYWAAQCVNSKSWPGDTPELALLSATAGG